jgi:hypothetical protein
MFRLAFIYECPNLLFTWMQKQLAGLCDTRLHVATYSIQKAITIARDGSSYSMVLKSLA